MKVSFERPVISEGILFYRYGLVSNTSAAFSRYCRGMDFKPEMHLSEFGPVVDIIIPIA